MATGDLLAKFCADWSSGSRDMLADRQTDRGVDRNALHLYKDRVTIKVYKNRICAEI